MIMDYKEKYEMALETIQEILDSGKDSIKMSRLKLILQSVFPELKESEDEKIRKALIEMVHDTTCDELWVDYNIHKEEALIWLEKQSEQKPTDKIEPKFKVGDWITNGRYAKRIVGINSDWPYYMFEDGKSKRIKEIDKKYHLWTIEDTKDGDVLAFYTEHKGNKMVQVGIIEKYVGKHGGCSKTFKIYAGVNWENNLQIGRYMGCSDIQPATKEQRELLFTKMKEADYVWDAEKKELKKVEDENYDGEDYGIDSLFHAQRILEKTHGKVDGYQTDDGILSHKCAIAAVNKLYKQKPAEWSEEDEHTLQGVIDEIQANKNQAPDYDLETYDRFLSWLKSLKNKVAPQKQWKPSDAQMQALKEACDKSWEPDGLDPLYTLYKDLEKLKGE